MNLLPLVASATIAGAVICVVMALFGKGDRQQALERLVGGHEPTLGRAGGAASALSGALRRRSLSSLPVLDALLGRSEWATRVALDLERAEVRLKVGEYLLIRFAFTGAAGIGIVVLSGLPLAGIVAAVIAFMLPPFYIKMKQRQRIRRLEGQLTEMLTMVSNALKAGFGLMQGLDHAADQIEAPLSTELRRTLRDIAIGASIEDALTALNDRCGSKDLDIVITAILVQRTAGGNLSEILDTVAHTIRERERIKGEIRTLTTQQMYTGYVLGALPLGMALLLALLSRDYMQPLFTTGIGHGLIAAGLIMDGIGFFIIRRILAIEV